MYLFWFDLFQHNRYSACHGAFCFVFALFWGFFWGERGGGVVCSLLGTLICVVGCICLLFLLLCLVGTGV